MCILLVEDDLIYQQVMAETLRREGYEVEEASDGRSGIAMFDERQEQFTVLIVNFQLVGSFNGKDVADYVRARRPRLPIIVASGDERALAASWHKRAGYTVLSKPYRAAELLLLVRMLARTQ